jgi:hypothetical protein
MFVRSIHHRVRISRMILAHSIAGGTLSVDWKEAFSGNANLQIGVFRRVVLANLSVVGARDRRSPPLCKLRPTWGDVI